MNEMSEILIRTLVPIGTVGALTVPYALIRRRDFGRVIRGDAIKAVYALNSDFSAKELANEAFLKLTSDGVELSGVQIMAIPFSKITSINFHRVAAPFLQSAMTEIIFDGGALKFVCIRFMVFRQFAIFNRTATAAMYALIKNRIENQEPAKSSTQKQRGTPAIYQWVWYVGLLLSMACFQVLAQSPTRAYLGYLFLFPGAFFIYKILSPFWGRKSK